MQGITIPGKMNLKLIQLMLEFVSFAPKEMSLSPSILNVCL
jgi:hypothetical protein